jgi:glycosidase
MTNGNFRCLKQIQDIESHTVNEMAKSLGIPAKIRWNMIRRGTRDNGRMPMQWSDEKNAGFTTGKPWLKVNGDYKEVNVKNEQTDPDGVLNFWKKMIALRRTDEVLIDGEFVPVMVSNNIFVFERVLNGRRLLSLCNMTGKAVKLPKYLQAWQKKVIGNYPMGSADFMQPFEFRLMEESGE